jgi:hypothetical protein
MNIAAFFAFFFIGVLLLVGLVATIIISSPTYTPEIPSKILHQELRYRVSEFIDPVTHKRYLVFDSGRGVSVVEALLPEAEKP